MKIDSEWKVREGGAAPGSREARLLLHFFLLCSLASLTSSDRFHPHMKGRRYELTLYIRNHNVTEATFFRLVGVDNTADFIVRAGETFEQTFEVRRKGYWTLFVEFPGDRYAKSPRKIISRDSHRKWVMEVYFYPGAVGFSQWHKIGRRTKKARGPRRSPQSLHSPRRIL